MPEEEVLAEGSGPIQDADSLAEAASAALAGDGDEEVVFEAAKAAEAPSAEAAEAPAPIGPGEAPADDDSGSKTKAKSKGKGRRGKRLEVEGRFAFSSMFSFLRDGVERTLEEVRHEAVVTFLALLEMAKLRLVALSQHEDEEIYIQRAADDLRARMEQTVARSDDYR